MATRKLTTPRADVQRAWGYARVSTDQQADSNISLDEQQRKDRGPLHRERLEFRTGLC
jgi:hypothetical protein